MDPRALDEKLSPFLLTLGDLFFRAGASAEARANISADPIDVQTETDVAAEKHVCAFLTSLADIPILSEEADKEDGDKDIFAKADAYWVVDPIDGTVFFQRLEYGEFGTLVSLVENGSIIGAWAYFPGKTPEEDVILKSLTPDTVEINNVPVERVDPSVYAGTGRLGISKFASHVTEEERARLNENTKHWPPRGKVHGALRLARQERGFITHIGSSAWDFTVTAKIVTAFGGIAYKFDDQSEAVPYENDAIIDDEKIIVMALPGVDIAARLQELFKGTRWEKNSAPPACV